MSTLSINSAVPPGTSELKREIVVRSIKLLDIGYITIIYFIAALISCILMDKFFGEFDQAKEEKKNLTQIITELLVYMWFLGIVMYIVRNLVELVPFPLEGIYGFQHKRVKELGNAYVFVFILMTYQFYFRNRLNYLFTRIKTEYGY